MRKLRPVTHRVAVNFLGIPKGVKLPATFPQRTDETSVAPSTNADLFSCRYASGSDGFGAACAGKVGAGVAGAVPGLTKG